MDHEISPSLRLRAIVQSSAAGCSWCFVGLMETVFPARRWRLAMTSSLRLSTLVLTASACALACLPRSAWSAARPSSAESAGTQQPTPVAPRSSSSSASSPEVIIPGPLRSFLRMAGISQKVSRQEVLPLTARNVVMYGYQDVRARTGKPTEFLILLRRYIDQARELQALAGPAGAIRVSKCGESKSLLMVIGYRLRQPCGPDTSVETSDPDRAFLTIDSGFPLADLEETLRGGKPFTYAYSSTRVPYSSRRATGPRPRRSKEALEKRGTGMCSTRFCETQFSLACIGQWRASTQKPEMPCGHPRDW